MAAAKDPTEPIRQHAVSFPEVAIGSSCNQSSFKAGTGSFLFIGPGAKGQGYKAMFKLNESLPAARQLAAKHPQQFQVGSTGWVTARFSAERPLAKSIWKKWLQESYEICLEGKKPNKKPTPRQSVSKAAVKKRTVKKSTSKKKKAPRRTK